MKSKTLPPLIAGTTCAPSQEAQTPLSIVVPDGSMQEATVTLLGKAGLPVIMEKRRTKEGKIAVDWIKRIVFQRPQEIPLYLNNNHFDMAIVGEDWIANWGYKFPTLLKLPIGRGGRKPVRIVLAVSEDSPVQSAKDLPQGCEVATEYVQLAARFFRDSKRPDIRVVPSYGNTEQKIKYGASAIIDVTESGESLKENQLRIIQTLMESNTLVVANEQSLKDPSKQFNINTFARLINGAFQAMQYVKMTANVPQKSIGKATKVLGGLKGPTCSPLRGVRGWFALQSIVPKQTADCPNNEQRVIRELLKINVTDILVERDIPLIMS